MGGKRTPLSPHLVSFVSFIQKDDHHVTSVPRHDWWILFVMVKLRKFNRFTKKKGFYFVIWMFCGSTQKPIWSKILFWTNIWLIRTTTMHFTKSVTVKTLLWTELSSRWSGFPCCLLTWTQVSLPEVRADQGFRPKQQRHDQLFRGQCLMFSTNTEIYDLKVSNYFFLHSAFSNRVSFVWKNKITSLKTIPDLSDDPSLIFPTNQPFTIIS